jgi:hypothetical protein
MKNRDREKIIVFVAWLAARLIWAGFGIWLAWLLWARVLPQACRTILS